MGQFRMKRNARNNFARRTTLRTLNFLRYNKRLCLVIFGAFAVIAGAIVLIISLSNSASAKTVSNTDPVPTYTNSTNNTDTTETQTVQTVDPSDLPTTTPEVTPVIDLKKGDDSAQVQVIQERLMDLNYLDIDDSTQHYGSATEQAVERFQREANILDTNAGLKEDGVTDNSTYDYLLSSAAKPYMLLKGMEGEDVRSLQFRLIELGYLGDGKITSHYGDDTTKAVKDFQKANKLTVDGKTGEDTLNIIFSSKAKPTPEKAKAIHAAKNASEVIAAAKAVKGKPYVGGREGPDSFDCSGLVYWCLHRAGSTIGRYNAQGYSAVARWKVVCEDKFNWNKLLPGDLLFFHVPTRNKEIGHVAIYIGHHTVIDASSSNGMVVERKCDTPWFVKNFRLARRPYGDA